MRCLRYRVDWKLKRLGRGSLARSQELRVGGKAYSWGPGSLPRVGRALDARPSQVKEHLSNHSCDTQDTELPWHVLTHGPGTAGPRGSYCTNRQPRPTGPQTLL